MQKQPQCDLLIDSINCLQPLQAGESMSCLLICVHKEHLLNLHSLLLC